MPLWLRWWSQEIKRSCRTWKTHKRFPKWLQYSETFRKESFLPRLLLSLIWVILLETSTFSVTKWTKLLISIQPKKVTSCKSLSSLHLHLQRLIPWWCSATVRANLSSKVSSKRSSSRRGNRTGCSPRFNCKIKVIILQDSIIIKLSTLVKGLKSLNRVKWECLRR